MLRCTVPKCAQMYLTTNQRSLSTGMALLGVAWLSIGALVRAWGSLERRMCVILRSVEV